MLIKIIVIRRPECSHWGNLLFIYNFFNSNWDYSIMVWISKFFSRPSWLGFYISLPWILGFFIGGSSSSLTFMFKGDVFNIIITWVFKIYISNLNNSTGDKGKYPFKKDPVSRNVFLQ